MAAAKEPSKPKNLQETLKSLRSGKNAIDIGAFSGFNMTPKGMTTGNLSFDALTGIGGIPEGRVTEFVGPPSSGKTTAALQAMAKVQQKGDYVAFFDYERSLDPVYCAALGLDVHAENFLYMQPQHFEEGANVFRALISTGEVRLGTFDSVAAMVTQHELEAETGKVQVADRAKMMHQFLRQLTPSLSATKTGVIFLNHIMELVDATPMGARLAAQGIKRKTSPGGRALPFYASLRVEFNQIGSLRTKEMDLLNNEEIDQVTQTKVEATIIKNKVAPTLLRKAELRVRFGLGFSQAFSILEVLTNHNVVKKSGAWFTFPVELRLDGSDDNAKLQGEDYVLSQMEKNPEWFALLEKAATKVVDQLGADTFDVVDSTDFMVNEQADADLSNTDSLEN